MAFRRAPPYRVFLGLREVAGYLCNLQRGFDALGIESTLVSLAGHAFQYEEGARNPAWASRVNRLAQRIGSRLPGGSVRRLIWIFLSQTLLGPLVLLRAIFTHDVFVLTSLSTFCGFLELPLLRLFRKTVIHVFLGSDSRPIYLSGYVVRGTSPRAIGTGVLLARVQHAMVRVVERFADEVVNIPPQSHFHVRPIVSGYAIGMPMRDLAAEAPEPPPAGPGARAVRVLHAPSNPGPKGTAQIRATIEAIRASGHQVDYVEISGRTNREVIEELRRCDFVIDEVHSDTPLSGFATEAACLGRPAVVGSYYAPQIGNAVPAADMPPSAFCHPDRLRSEVERLVVDAAWRAELGQRARAFVTGRWSARAVAEKFVLLIEGRCPPEWRFLPAGIRYLHGCGLGEAEARARIRAFLARGGPGALCVRDKPELEAALIAFAREPA